MHIVRFFVGPVSMNSPIDQHVVHKITANEKIPPDGGGLNFRLKEKPVRYFMFMIAFGEKTPH